MAAMTGTEMIAAERERQIKVKAWSTEHDDTNHDQGQLLAAGRCYAMMADCLISNTVFEHASWLSKMAWPWGDEWWKPSDDPIRNLVKAGALIAAEIDRLQRLKEKND